MRLIATIGVYGFTAESFTEKLTGARVELLLDVRQRRGVRGPEYAWANSARLQQLLADAGIGYRHVKELAPTTRMRQLQYREDDRQGVGKRDRVTLAPEYTEHYLREILDPFDLGALVAELRAELTRVQDELRDLTDTAHRDEMARARQLARIEQLQARAVEELGIDPDVLVAEFGPDTPVPHVLGPDDDPGAEHPPVPYVRDEQEKRLRRAERAERGRAQGLGQGAPRPLQGSARDRVPR